MQYKTGTANVTQSSQTVTGTGTAWLANVTPGDGFTIAGSGVPYTVASVETDTSLTLSAPYAGATASGQVYTVWRDFTTNFDIPELSQGDIETATIWTRAARIIDGGMAKVDNIALQGTVGVYGSTANGLAGTTAGDYFFVVDAANLVLYLNDAGAATLVGTYPLLEDIQADFDASLVELQAQQDAFQADHVAADDPHPQYLLESDNFASVASAPAAFDNIKQAATETSTGVVEKATTAEVEAGAADKFPDAAGVKSYVGSVVGDISSTLDAINGEVV